MTLAPVQTRAQNLKAKNPFCLSAGTCAYTGQGGTRSSRRRSSAIQARNRIVRSLTVQRVELTKTSELSVSAGRFSYREALNSDDLSSVTFLKDLFQLARIGKKGADLDLKCQRNLDQIDCRQIAVSAFYSRVVTPRQTCFKREVFLRPPLALAKGADLLSEQDELWVSSHFVTLVT